MPKYRFRVQDLCWTEMNVTVDADTEREAVEKVAKQDDDVKWGQSTVFWEASEKTEIYDFFRKRKLWDSKNGFPDPPHFPQVPISVSRTSDKEE